MNARIFLKIQICIYHIFLHSIYFLSTSYSLNSCLIPHRVVLSAAKAKKSPFSIKNIYSFLQPFICTHEKNERICMYVCWYFNFACNLQHSFPPPHINDIHSHFNFKSVDIKVIVLRTLLLIGQIAIVTLKSLPA